jgi:hypothetical protein
VSYTHKRNVGEKTLERKRRIIKKQTCLEKNERGGDEGHHQAEKEKRRDKRAVCNGAISTHTHSTRHKSKGVERKQFFWGIYVIRARRQHLVVSRSEILIG